MGKGARTINIVLGIWLFVSALIWPHAQAQFTNTWILGIICTAAAMIATSVDEVRFVNTAAAVWLFLSAFWLPTRTAGTIWNNALVAIAIFAFSLIPAGGRRAPSRFAPVAT